MPRRKRKRYKLKKGVIKAYGLRNRNVRSLGFKDYEDYLRGDIWKRQRARVLDRSPDCYSCFKSATQVHHTKYNKEILAGESDDGLISVCSDCHKWSETTVKGKKSHPLHATTQLRQKRKRNKAIVDRWLQSKEGQSFLTREERLKSIEPPKLERVCVCSLCGKEFKTTGSLTVCPKCLR